MLVDKNSGLQLHFLGQIKRRNGAVVFTVATAENGFITPLDPDLFDLIRDLGNKVLGRDYSEDALSRNLRDRLKLD